MTAREDRKPLLLFICTANSARSQMAEALMRRHAGEHFEIHSAGVRPTGINPLTIRVLEEIGLDTGGLRSQGLDEYLGKVHVNRVFIVCAQAQRDCPRIHGATATEFWPLDDPAAAEGTEEQRLERFREIRDQIDARIRGWLAGQGIASAVPAVS
jgi:arsenate reductase